jgi:hypothetical protein
MLRTCWEHVVYMNCSECQNKNKKTIYVHNMFSTCSELGIFMYWTRNSMNNLSSYCGLVDVRISASEKDLPVRFSSILLLVITLPTHIFRVPCQIQKTYPRQAGLKKTGSTPRGRYSIGFLTTTEIKWRLRTGVLILKVS